MKIKIGERIKELRKRDDITQERLAEVLGVTSQAVSKWENESGYPDIEYIKPIANFFNVTIDYLFANGATEIEAQFGCGLLPLLDEKQGSNFRELTISLKQKFAEETGVVIDSICYRDNIKIPPNDYIIKIKEEQVARGELLPDKYLIMSDEGNFFDIDGIKTRELAFGMPALWISPSEVKKAEKLGFVIIDPFSAFITHLSEIIKKHIHQFK